MASFRVSDSTGKMAVLVVFVVTMLVLLLPCNAAEDNGNNDTNALTLFRRNADVHGILASNWTTSDACSGRWVGVRCGVGIGTRVTSLSLPSIDLRGPLDPLVTLSELRALDLHSNRLNGTLHGVASSFPNLKLLYLSRNDLSGEIPPLLLGSSRRLRRLDLSSNNLRGSIPPLVGNLTGLLTLRLQNNLLSGTIPNGTDLLLRLVDFDVSNNELAGVVPQSIRDKFGDDPFAGNAALCATSPPFSFALHSCSGNNTSASSSSSSPSPSPTTSDTTTVTNSVVPSNPSSFPGTSTVSSSEAHGERRKGGSGKGRLSVGVIIGIAIANATVILLLMSSLFYVYFCYFSKASSIRRTVAGDEDDEEEAVEKSVRGSGTEDEEKQRVKYYYNGFYHKQNSGRRDHQEGSSAIAAAARGGTVNKNNDKLVFFDEDRSGLHVQRFDLEDLLRSSAEMVGKGSLGTVYRAVLEDGCMVAVKRLRDSNPCDRADFEGYMDLIARLSNRHPNLVPLRAYYYATQEKLLIYDYLPNSTLHAVIHSGRETQSDESESDWSARVGLALGTARGLASIHNHQEDVDDEENVMTNRPVIPHGNVTSSNVLIDGNGNARLSDFGLALLLDPANATAKLGGYRAPEQILTKTLSQQADVYAFGIILLELLTGKDPSSQQLPEWVRSGLREEEEGIAEVFDASLLLLQHKNVRQDMLAMVDVALACVSDDPEHRPIMSEVVNMITSIIRRHEMESEDDPPISSSPSIVGNDDDR